jgi:hypothetical protein
MNRSHSAKYLVLIGPRTARRALLFNHEHRYLGEVIDDDDGPIVDALLDAARACKLPAMVRLEGLVPAAQLAGSSVQCFALAEATSTSPPLETVGRSGL